MSFTDFTFFLFAAAVLLLYYTLFKKRQALLLLLASVTFYLFSGPKYILYLLASSLSTWGFARALQRLHRKRDGVLSSEELSREQEKALFSRHDRHCQLLLIADLVLVLGLLTVVKYGDFVLSGVSALLRAFGLNWSGRFGFVLPLGISFYTFMAVGYVLDIYWEKYPAEKSYFRVLLFMSYFPHILQGPIGRFDRMSPQFDGVHPFHQDRFCRGLQLSLWGLFEKLVVADRLAVFTNAVFASRSVTGLTLVAALVFCSIRFYMDFKGCMDIGRGISEALGIELEKNFDHPFFSKTMLEFWRRWHITLGAWFKDYLLYPVSMSRLCKKINRSTRKKWGNRVSRTVSTIIPTACVWVVTGLWHGASMNYLIWGIYHGALVILSTLFELPIQKLNEKLHIRTEGRVFNLFRMARTFALSSLGRVLFVTTGLGAAADTIRRMFDLGAFNLHMLWNGGLYTFGLDESGFVLAIVLILVVWAVSLLQEKMCLRDAVARQNIFVRWALYYGLLFAVIIFGMYGPGYDASGFLYGQF